MHCKIILPTMHFNVFAVRILRIKITTIIIQLILIVTLGFTRKQPSNKIITKCVANDLETTQSWKASISGQGLC